jgi:hypothetical protein
MQEAPMQEAFGPDKPIGLRYLAAMQPITTT